MKAFLFLLNSFLLLSLFQIAISGTCENGEFKIVKTLEQNGFKVAPGNETCLKYKLKDTKGKLGLFFEIANLYTAEVVIYKSQKEISLKDGSYQNPFINYSIALNPFKEIDTKEFDEYVYIIIRDKYNYFFNDYLTLYDSEEIIELKDGVPLTIPHFLSNLKYQLSFTSSSPFKLVYNAKNPTPKKVIALFENEALIDGNDDSYSVEFIPKSKEGSKLSLTIELEKSDEEQDNEFSLIVFTNYSEIKRIIPGEILETKYVYYNGTQDYYFYADISSFKSLATINFKFDFMLKTKNSANISAKIVTSEKELSGEDFVDKIPEKNELPIDYDVDSDEFQKVYIKANSSASKFKYVLIKVKLALMNINYVPPKIFTTSISKEVSITDLTQIQKYKARTINYSPTNYIPHYIKLLLQKEEKYIISTKNQEDLLFIKGDLLTSEGAINYDFLYDEKEIKIITGLSELTMVLYGYKINPTIFVEKIDSNQENDIIIEEERSNEPVKITMSQEECDSKIEKHLVGTYDIDNYSYGANKVNAYAYKEEGDFDLYYKDFIDLENTSSLFPTLPTEIKEYEKIIILQRNIDLFTFTCKKPGSIYLRLQRKSFAEKTHFITQNSIQTINLLNDYEIIQLSSPIGKSNDTLYFSILSVKGSPITISPTTEGLFEKKTIQDNEIFKVSFDLSKYKMDQLAVKVGIINPTTIEIIETISNRYNKYEIIDKESLENIDYFNFFIKVNKNISSVDLNIKGLEGKTVSYAIVKLASDDTNYIPLANKFENNNKQKIDKNEFSTKVKNPFYNIEEDEYKKNQILVFSVLGAPKELKYNIKYTMNKEQNEKEEENKSNDKIMNIFLIAVIVIALIIAFVTFILIRKKKGINVETMNNNTQPLYPSNNNNDPEELK